MISFETWLYFNYLKSIWDFTFISRLIVCWRVISRISWTSSNLCLYTHKWWDVRCICNNMSTQFNPCWGTLLAHSSSCYRLKFIKRSSFGLAKTSSKSIFLERRYETRSSNRKNFQWVSKYKRAMDNEYDFYLSIFLIG